MRLPRELLWVVDVIALNEHTTAATHVLTAHGAECWPVGTESAAQLFQFVLDTLAAEGMRPSQQKGMPVTNTALAGQHTGVLQETSQPGRDSTAMGSAPLTGNRWQ